MIASHYAAPLDQALAVGASLRSAPSADAPVIGELAAGETFATVENSVGWAWGYAGAERRVGYVPSEALA